MRRNLHLMLLALSFLFFVSSCTKEKENLTESVSIKAAATPTSLTTVVVEGTSQITITLSKAANTGAEIVLSPTFEMAGNGYTISPASGTAVSFGLSTALKTVTYTVTNPSGVKRLYSARVLFHATL